MFVAAVGTDPHKSTTLVNHLAEHEERRHCRLCPRRGVACHRQVVVPTITSPEAQPHSTSASAVFIGGWLRWKSYERLAISAPGKEEWGW